MAKKSRVRGRDYFDARWQPPRTVGMDMLRICGAGPIYTKTMSTTIYEYYRDPTRHDWREKPSH